MNKSFYGKEFIRLLLSCTLVHLLCTITHAQTTVDSSRIVRVLSYNIYHGQTVNAESDFDLDLLAKIINDVEPDLVALQEVDYKTKRAKRMDLATELGLRTGLAPLFGQAMPYDGGGYGVGILSKAGFLKTQNHQLPGEPDREPRTALETNIVWSTGDTIRFISTHFDNVRDEIDKIKQANKINELFSEDNRPSIIAGDLNARPESKTIDILTKKWTKSFVDNIPTAPAINPKRKIDYILFRPAERWRVLETRVIDEQVGSDHRPVLSVLELLTEN